MNTIYTYIIIGLVATGSFIGGHIASKSDYTTNINQEIQINKSKISENDIYLKKNCQPLMVENQKLKDRNGDLSDSLITLNPKIYICYDIDTKTWTNDKYTKFSDEYTWIDGCNIGDKKGCYVNEKYNCIEK